MLNRYFLRLLLGIALCFSGACLFAQNTSVNGKIESHPGFPSAYVPSRTVDIYLPPGYETDTVMRYPVLYMHDGQNLFQPGSAFGGQEWKVDEVLDSLIAAAAVRPCIVVGIWNTPNRFAEYMPQIPAQQFPDSIQQKILAYANRLPFSDDYLVFMVGELKPFVDRQYRTLPGPDDTFVAGSSMGGLISLYAICRYPEVFGGAACLSTHWIGDMKGEYPEVPAAFIDYFGGHLPDPSAHKLYFDHGDVGLDALYGPHQKNMNQRLSLAGYQLPVNLEVEVFPGADHSETAWSQRIHLPLSFLLGRQE